MKTTSNYEEFVELVKTPTGREDCHFQDFLTAKDDLDSSIVATPKKEELQTLYNILRYLRNSCVQCKKNQNLILKSKILETVVDRLLVTLLSPHLVTDTLNKDIFEKVKLTSLQFLGNLSVQNEKTQEAIWKIGFPSLFFNMMAHLNDKEKDCLCMVIYNCILNRDNIFEKDEEFWLFTSIAEFAKECINTEWGLLIIELVVTSKCFVQLYKRLSLYSQPRGVLLDFMSGYLSDDQVSSKDVPEDNILFLAEEFQNKSTCILMLAKEITDEFIEECMILVKVLSVLCSSSAFYRKYNKLRRKETLLKSSVDLLIKMCGSDVTQPPDDKSLTSEDENHPIPILRRDLIRLIGNLCYKNQHFQTLTRQYNGVTPILNSCYIDQQNPFMMQWAIFAIRNLCDGNRENQDMIKSLRTQGVATNKFLDDMKISVDVVNDKVKITSNVVRLTTE